MLMNHHPNFDAEFKFNKEVNNVTNNLDDDNNNDENELVAPVEQKPCPREIEILMIITSCIFISFIFYNTYHRRHVDFFDPNSYLEPCNVTGVLSDFELIELKEKISSLESEYDKLYRKPQQDLIPDDVKLAEKLSTNYTIFEKHYKTQRDIRLKCYKENLYPKVCTEFTAVLGCHLFIEYCFMVLLFYYAWKYNLLKNIYFYVYQTYSLMFCILWGTCFFIQYFGYEVCKVPESYIKEFPL